MDKNWMPDLEHAELYGINRAAERWGGGPGPDSSTVLKVGANKRQNLTGSRLEGEVPKLHDLHKFKVKYSPPLDFGTVLVCTCIT